jgi:flagellar basal body-associated protein FliL
VRGVLILAIVMGVMLVVGTVVLIAVIISRVEHPVPARSAARPYAPAPIEIPHGARIAAMRIQADRLVVDLALPQGDQEIVVINLATGARLGTIRLRAAP